MTLPTPASLYTVAPSPTPTLPGVPVRCRLCGAVIGYSAPNGMGRFKFIPATLEIEVIGHGRNSIEVTHTAAGERTGVKCGGVKIFGG